MDSFEEEQQRYRDDLRSQEIYINLKHGLDWSDTRIDEYLSPLDLSSVRRRKNENNRY